MTQLTHTKSCHMCGQEYESRQDHQIYCSSKCRAQKAKERFPLTSEKIENRSCKTCGKTFEVSNKKNWGQVYCQITCRSSFLKAEKQKGKEKVRGMVECQVCGKEFAQIGKGRFKNCSEECAEIAMKINQKKNRKWKQQSGELQKLKRMIEKNVDHVFDLTASLEKDHVGVVRSSILNGEKFREDIRAKTLLRDDYKCQICESESSLHVHHLVKRKFGGPNELYNLITLCVVCHRGVETGDRDHAKLRSFYVARKGRGHRTKNRTTLNFALNNSLSVMNATFKHLSESGEADAETLKELDTAINYLEDVL